MFEKEKSLGENYNEFESLISLSLENGDSRDFLDYLDVRLNTLQYGYKLKIDLNEIHCLLSSDDKVLKFFAANKSKMEFSINGHILDEKDLIEYIVYGADLMSIYEEAIDCVPMDFVGLNIFVGVVYDFFKHHRLWVSLDPDFFLCFLKNVASSLEGLNLENCDTTILQGVFDKCFEVSRFFNNDHSFIPVNRSLLDLERMFMPDVDCLIDIDFLKKCKNRGEISVEHGDIVLKQVLKDIGCLSSAEVGYMKSLGRFFEILDLLEVDLKEDKYKSLIFRLSMECLADLDVTKSISTIKSYLLLLAIVSCLYFSSDEGMVVDLFDKSLSNVKKVDIDDLSFDSFDIAVVESFGFNFSNYSILSITRSHVEQILASWR